MEPRGRAGGKASIKKLMMKIFYIEILIHFTFMYRDKCFFYTLVISCENMNCNFANPLSLRLN